MSEPEITEEEIERVAIFLYEDGWRNTRTWRDAYEDTKGRYRQRARGVLKARVSETVELAPEPEVTDEMVARFKEAWHEADGRGEAGNRVRAGLSAALRDSPDIAALNRVRALYATRRKLYSEVDGDIEYSAWCELVDTLGAALGGDPE